MVLNDLLGPVGGPEEEIDEPSVRDRYLVGMLAPKRQELSPEEFDELPQGGSGTAEDGTAETTAPAAKTMFPSSLRDDLLRRPGRRGAPDHRPLGPLPPGPQRDARPRPSGEKKLVWKRTPAGGRLGADPAPGRPAATGRPTPSSPRSQVQGLVRKRDHFWIVTLFLVNGQEEPKKLRDTAWLFQPELVVESPDGKPIFHSRPAAARPRQDRPGHVRRGAGDGDALPPPRRVRASGHGVSVHAELPRGRCDRAVRLATSVVPDLRGAPHHAARPSPTGPGWPGWSLDMKELAETPTAELGREAAAPARRPTRRGSTDRQADLEQARHGRRTSSRARRPWSGAGTALAPDRGGPEAARARTSRPPRRSGSPTGPCGSSASTRSIALKRRRDEHGRRARPSTCPPTASWYPVPAGLHPAQPAGHHQARPPGPQRARPRPSPTCSGSPPAAARPRRTSACRPTRWACGGCRAPSPGRSGEQRRGRADALHAAAADHPAVPAGHGPDLRLRGRSAASDESEVGQGAVPHRPVGRPEDHPEHDRPGRRGDQAGARRQVQGRGAAAPRPS